MKLLDKIFSFTAKSKIEDRAEEIIDDKSLDDVLLSAFLGRTSVNRDDALQIATISGGIDLISTIVASLPIKLYTENEDGNVEEIKTDDRLTLLNDTTGDELSPFQMKKAMIYDYYLEKGGYIYINKSGNKIESLHYVDATAISINKGTDHIFKKSCYYIDGKAYYPYEFIKLLRNTKEGAESKGIVTESSDLIGTVYQSMIFEQNLVKKGGLKKGFLKSENKLDQDAMTLLREGFSKLYSNTSEKVVVLNKGIDFKETSATSVEMQLNENKKTNAGELEKLLHISGKVLSGEAGTVEIQSFMQLLSNTILKAFEAALNNDLLLEKEKHNMYFACDTREAFKGTLKERYEAYKAGIESNVLQIDEARYMEDLPNLGLNFIKLGLQDVLYDPKTGEVYTPNTNQKVNIKKGDEPKDED